MNSLQDLNNYSLTSISFNDTRDYSIAFRPTSPANETIQMPTTLYHVAQPMSDITSVVNPTGNVTYTIDLSTGNSGESATVTWPTLPEGVIASTPNTNVYRVTGVNTAAIWETIKSPVIQFSPNISTWTYTSTIAYPSFDGNTSKSWTNTVNTGVSIGDMTTPANVSYTYNSTTQITTSPNVSFTGTATLTINSNNPDAVEKIYSTYTAGGSVRFSRNNKSLKITGTQAQINAHLDALYIKPATDYKTDFRLFYTLVDSVGARSQVAQNALIDRATITRTFYQNGYDLVFATDTPTIVNTTPSGTYKLVLEYPTNVGFFTDGNSLTSPAGVTSGAFQVGGTYSELVAAIPNIRYIPALNYFNDFTVSYKIYINDVLQYTRTFNMLGTARTNLIIGGTTNQTVTEDSDNINPGVFTIYPHWSQPYSLIFSTYKQGLANSNSTWYNTSGTSWQYVGSQYAPTQLYKNYSAATTVSGFIGNLAELSSLSLTLQPDVIDTFTLKQQFINNGSYNGTTFTGTEYSAQKDFAITAHNEYSLTTAYNYTEDTKVALTFSILDEDPTTSGVSYTITIDQTVPSQSVNPGRFIIDGVAGSWGSPAVLTGSKSALNAKIVEYDPAGDYTGSITLTYSQTKTINGVTAIQASAVPMTLTNTGTHTDYSLTTAYNYVEDGLVTLAFSILDNDDSNPTYIINIEQITPSPSTTPGAFVVDGTYQTFGQPLNINGNKNTLNEKIIEYRAPVDYNSTVTLRYTQYKVTGGVNVLQADQTITLTNIGTTSELQYPTSLNYTSYTGGQAFASIVSILDNPNDSPGFTYSLTVRVEDTRIGNLFDSRYSGTYQQLTWTGTKSYINGILSNYISIVTSRGRMGTGTITYNLTRTAPDNTQIVTNATTTVTLVEPTVGQSYNTSGGYYVGNVVISGTTYHQFTVSAGFGEYFLEFRNPVVPKPSANSADDGLANCNAIDALGYDAYYTVVIDSLNYASSGVTVNGYFHSGVSDYYVPAENEFTVIRNNLYSFFGTYFTNKYYTSTIDSTGLRCWNEASPGGAPSGSDGMATITWPATSGAIGAGVSIYMRKQAVTIF